MCLLKCSEEKRNKTIKRLLFKKSICLYTRTFTFTSFCISAYMKCLVVIMFFIFSYGRWFLISYLVWRVSYLATTTIKINCTTCLKKHHSTWIQDNRIWLRMILPKLIDCIFVSNSLEYQKNLGLFKVLKNSLITASSLSSNCMRKGYCLLLRKERATIQNIYTSINTHQEVSKLLIQC